MVLYVPISTPLFWNYISEEIFDFIVNRKTVNSTTRRMSKYFPLSIVQLKGEKNIYELRRREGSWNYKYSYIFWITTPKIAPRIRHNLPQMRFIVK